MAQSIQDLIAGKQKDIAAKKARASTLKPHDGKHSYRILPSWRGGEEKQFWHDYSMHFVKTVESGQKPAAVYLCVDKTYGKPCEVCESIKKAMAHSSDDAMTKRLKEAQSAQRYLMNVLHLTGTEPGKVQVLELGTTAFEAVCALIGEWGDITDPHTGRDIVITRSGTGLDTKYTVQPAAVTKPVPAAALTQLVNLDEFVAQENPAGEVKALTAVASIIGVTLDTSAPALPKGSSAALASLGSDIEDAEYTAVGTPGASGASSGAATVDADLDADLADLDGLLEG